jgi:hypothetical protein
MMMMIFSEVLRISRFPLISIGASWKDAHTRAKLLFFKEQGQTPCQILRGEPPVFPHAQVGLRDGFLPNHLHYHVFGQNVVSHTFPCVYAWRPLHTLEDLKRLLDSMYKQWYVQAPDGKRCTNLTRHKAYA